LLLAYAGLGAAVLILSLKTGLVLGMSRIKGSQVILASLAFGLNLGIMVMIFIPYQFFLVGLLDKYTFLGSLTMAVFLIYLGVEDQKETYGKSGCMTGKKYLMAFLPCPLCLIALALTVTILAQDVILSSKILGWGISGVFSGLLIIIALLYRKLIMVFHVNHVNVLNGFLLFLGVFTLCCGLFIPNFVQSMSMPFTPFVLTSGVWTAWIVLGMAAVSILGYVRYGLQDGKGE